ncbi:MAG: DUF1648 domain-containing protein [Micropruina sp.]|uniref:DUF5808 domain-containing protein n=1 Tax=Micropruina sp. TaxID=2737536 RepID=UPI0039E54A39
MIRTIDELRPDARAVAQGFLDAATEATRRGLRSDVRADLTAHLCERLRSSATLADVEEVLAGLRPDDLAARAGLGWPSGLRPRGLLTRIAKIWWRPSDPRLLLPRAVGLGWDVNLGAVAVRLQLIEPDAEAVPFTSTREAAFRLAAALPVALAGATALHYAVRGRSLPPRLASHWDAGGRPDRWVSKERAALIDIGATAGAAALAGWAAVTASVGPTRAAALAGATMAATLGASVTVARPARGGVWLNPAMLTALGAGVGGVLLGLARAGRRVEIDRDLGNR